MLLHPRYPPPDLGGCECHGPCRWSSRIPARDGAPPKKKKTIADVTSAGMCFMPPVRSAKCFEDRLFSWVGGCRVLDAGRRVPKRLPSLAHAPHSVAMPLTPAREQQGLLLSCLGLAKKSFKVSVQQKPHLMLAVSCSPKSGKLDGFPFFFLPLQHLLLLSGI